MTMCGTEMTKTTHYFVKFPKYPPRNIQNLVNYYYCYYPYVSPTLSPSLPPILTSHENHPHSLMAILLSLSPHPPNPPHKPTTVTTPKPAIPTITTSSKRLFLLKTASLCIISLTPPYPIAHSSAEPSQPPKPALSGIANTKSWFQFYGSGFAIRVPPQFEDITEPEVYNTALSLICLSFCVLAFKIVAA